MTTNKTAIILEIASALSLSSEYILPLGNLCIALGFLVLAVLEIRNKNKKNK